VVFDRYGRSAAAQPEHFCFDYRWKRQWNIMPMNMRTYCRANSQKVCKIGMHPRNAPLKSKIHISTCFDSATSATLLRLRSAQVSTSRSITNPKSKIPSLFYLNWCQRYTLKIMSQNLQVISSAHG
jgi:hypothetical protein